MTSPLRFLFSLLVLLIAAGCSDDCPHQEGGTTGTDNFTGPYRTFTMGDETEGLPDTEIEIYLLAPDGSEIIRRATHTRSAGNRSTIVLSEGLREGTYRLQAAAYSDRSASVAGDDTPAEFGLGSRIRVDDGGITVIDSFNPTLRYAGRGTKDDPYIVSSSSHLIQLMLTVNDYDTNHLISENTYFRQTRDIDMKSASRSCDMEYGWLPIGSDTNTPFRGVYLADGHMITNLEINRPRSPGIGLFGYVYNATFDGLRMSRCKIAGQFAVGTVAGAVITSSESRGSGVFTNCAVTDCTVQGDDSSVAVGGVLGATDMYASTLLSDCSVSGGSLSGGYNVGGLTGGAGIYSSVMISGCRNSAPVTSAYSGAGGMIGTADTLQIAGCANEGSIRGATAYTGRADTGGRGAGGIAGGSGMSWITGSTNTATVSGYEGVGGIIGSTRVKGSTSDALVYNPAVLRYCSNSGTVTGKNFVGGTAGEAQFGCYAVCNTAPVSGADYVGGIVGNTSVAVAHNAVNSGDVHGSAYVAGIVGKCTWGSLALDHNTGRVNGSGHTAGIVALTGNNTVVHYCGNFGTVSSTADAPIGGIVAEVGDPRQWTALNIAECVIGSLECVMAVAGPVIACVEHVTELAHGVEIALKIFEINSEIYLQSADYVLLGYSIDEIVAPEAEEELRAHMRACSDQAAADVVAAMSHIRRQCGGDASGFDPACLSSGYIDNVDALKTFYEGEGNDELFNDAINEAREARAEKLESVAKANEIAHTVVAGVAVFTSTVALIGGSVLSGGAAAPFIIAGSLAAVVGGVNAITKSCTEFEHNAVIISQCLNAGQIEAPGNRRAAAIVGVLNDGADIHDCLNTASCHAAEDYFICAEAGSHCDVSRCISLVYGRQTKSGLAASSVCRRDDIDGDTHWEEGLLYAKKCAISDAATYDRAGISLGGKSPWTSPAGTAAYPVPNYSEMQTDI